MDKDYGPKGFEKAWNKALSNFDETKMFFEHGRGKTIIKYIDGNKLLGVEVYRCQYEIDHWLGHFQHYLNTGVFDTDAYWREHWSKKVDGEVINVDSIVVYPMPMVLKNKIWSVHSREISNFMDAERQAKGDLGFKLVSRP